MSDQQALATLVAVEDVEVDQLPAIQAAASSVHDLRSQAERVSVHDEVSAETAATLLGLVVAARQHAESQRLELTRPLRGVVDKINGAAKRTIAPLEDVEQVLKTKLGEYQAEQRRKVEQRRRELEEEAERQRQAEAEERRKVEDVARREREIAARAAAEAEAEQARIAAERQRELARLDAEEVEYLTPLSDEDLHALNRSAGDDATNRRATIAGRILAQRTEAAEAAERAERTRQAEEEARRAEQEARQAAPLPIVAPAVLRPATTIRGQSGSVTSRQIWDYEVEDLRRLARAVADGRAPVDLIQISPELGKMVRRKDDPLRDLPGVRIFQKDSTGFRQA